MLRIMCMAISRMRWYALSLSVIAGATVMESPVCMPIGSKFSMVQITVTLLLLSRSNSNSYSCQPKSAFSTNTSWEGEASKPRFKAASNSDFSFTKPPPVPPKVNEGRITNGKPISCAISLPSKKEFATRDWATGTPISIIF